MTELVVPTKISYSDMLKKKSISPSNYKKFKIPNKTSLPLYDFFEKEPVRGTELNGAYTSVSPYFFMRTQAVRSFQFTPFNDKDSFVPCKKQDFERIYDEKLMNVVRAGDIFYVKGGSPGEVMICVEDIQAIFSSHYFKLRVKPQYRNYVFAVLKHPVGKLQIAHQPLGSIEGLDTFKEEYLKEIIIPLPIQKNHDDIILFVSILVDACVNRELEIKRKYATAIALIDEEITNNQTEQEKKFVMPTYNDLLVEKRLDTRIYSERLQKHNHRIEHYKRGFYQTLEDAGYTVFRGQNLQESNIGMSVYLERKKDSYVRLILSSTIGMDLQYAPAAWLGNSNRLKIIAYGDVIFTCRGDMGRVIIYLENDKQSITNIDNVHIRRETTSMNDSILLGFYLSYLREKRIITDIAIAGSGAGSFTQYHFDKIKVPKFSDKFRDNIARFYNTDLSTFRGAELGLEDDKIVEASGIYQLMQQIALIKRVLGKVIQKIADGDEISVSYPKLV